MENTEKRSLRLSALEIALRNSTRFNTAAIAATPPSIDFIIDDASKIYQFVVNGLTKD